MKNENPKSCLDYIGSKVKLAPTIAEEIEKHFGNTDCAKLFDVFAGTGAVSKWFLYNRQLDTIITNDFEVYSVSVCIATMRPISVESSYYEHLNSLPGQYGFIAQNCSRNRLFFTTHNAGKIDHMKAAILHKLDNNTFTIDKAMKLLGELTVAADKVSNTASVYGAYLKKFKKTALKEIEIKPLEPKFETDTRIFNLGEDANYIIDKIQGDILYIDPPYNQRQYGNNYHVLNYIADLSASYKYSPQGVVGIHKDWQRSLYCSKKKVTERLDHLIRNANFEHIVMSYSNRGIIPLITLKTILNQHGEILNIKSVEYKNFRADKSRVYDQEKTTEYIITLRKTKKPV